MGRRRCQKCVPARSTSAQAVMDGVGIVGEEERFREAQRGTDRQRNRETERQRDRDRETQEQKCVCVCLCVCVCVCALARAYFC